MGQARTASQNPGRDAGQDFDRLFRPVPAGQMKKNWKKGFILPIFHFFWLFFWEPGGDFVPGCHRTEEFVPGHLPQPLSRDKGTLGQGKCPCPGTKGQRDVPSWFVTSLGNANLNPFKNVSLPCWDYRWAEQRYKLLLKGKVIYIHLKCPKP